MHEDIAEAARIMEMRSRRSKREAWRAFFCGAAYGMHVALRILYGDKAALAELRRVEYAHQGEK